MAEKRLQEIRKIRLEKMQKLREMGIDPFPVVSFDKTQSKSITDSYGDFEDKEVVVAGRLMGWREHGAISFGHLQDEDGIIQLFVKEEDLKLTDSKQGTLGYRDLNLIDIGDIIYAKGIVTKSVRGEISIIPTEIKLLTKSLNPLPDKWHGLKDIEERYRKRYLDMIMNPEVKERLVVRSQVIDCIRDYLTDRGFIEVETPTLQPIYGGGFAKPFRTHHNALDSEFYLRISDEMYLKRMIVGGMEKVFEITKVFRNEGVDRDHNPEFTMFEAMIAYRDYQFGMDTIEEIFEHTAKRLFGTTEIEYQGTKLNFKKPWKRLKMVEAIKEYTGLEPLVWKTVDEAKDAARSIDIKLEKLEDLDRMVNIGEVVAFVFEEAVEEKLIQPTIIFDYPVEISPLAKECEDVRFTQRFEMFAMGSELGNNYTELNDPVDLRQRFVEEKKREEAGFDEAHQTDHDYLEAIEQGFPPTCGIAIGVDRMVMLFTDSKHIKEIIPFPTLRPMEKKIKGTKKKSDTLK